MHHSISSKLCAIFTSFTLANIPLEQPKPNYILAGIYAVLGHVVVKGVIKVIDYYSDKICTKRKTDPNEKG
jgi:hypothetical protein